MMTRGGMGMGKTSVSMVTCMLMLLMMMTVTVTVVLLLLLAPTTTTGGIKVVSERVTHRCARRRRLQARVDAGTTVTPQSLPCSMSASPHAMLKHHVELGIIACCRTEMGSARPYRGEGAPRVSTTTSSSPCGSSCGGGRSRGGGGGVVHVAHPGGGGVLKVVLVAGCWGHD